MIKYIICMGIGFGSDGVKYIPTFGFVSGAGFTGAGGGNPGGNHLSIGVGL